MEFSAASINSITSNIYDEDFISFYRKILLSLIHAVKLGLNRGSKRP